MRLRQITLNPLFRSLAALTLLIWLGAQVLCTIHCDFGGGHGESEQASCHGPAQSDSHRDDGESSTPTHPDSSPSTICLTLKSALVSGHALALTQPELQFLYTLAPVALALDATAIEPAARISRAAWHRDRVLTPEVCTGPANRSHAPPFVG